MLRWLWIGFNYPFWQLDHRISENRWTLLTYQLSLFLFHFFKIKSVGYLTFKPYYPFILPVCSVSVQCRIIPFWLLMVCNKHIYCKTRKQIGTLHKHRQMVMSHIEIRYMNTFWEYIRPLRSICQGSTPKCFRSFCCFGLYYDLITNFEISLSKAKLNIFKYISTCILVKDANKPWILHHLR